jgi:diamine N-acetyltransferase
MSQRLIKISLKELERENLPLLNQWRNNPDIMNFLGNNFIYIAPSVEEDWYASYRKNRHTQVRLAIFDAENQNHIGLVNLTAIHPVNRSAEFSILIGDPNYWSKGVGRQATLEMLRHGFHHLNLNRIELKVLKDNVRAIGLYKKCGFQEEGCQRAAIFKNGQYQDLLCMALLREDWQFENTTMN